MKKSKKEKTSTPDKDQSVQDSDQLESEDGAHLMALASIVYECLKKQELISVRIISSANEIETFQIETPDQIDSYILNLSPWPDLLSIADLTQKDGHQKAIIKQMSSAWLEMKRQSEKPFTVHLITNNLPSPRPLDKTAKKVHLASFMDTYYKIKKYNSDSFEIEDKWSNIWLQLQEASELGDNDFQSFVRQCRFNWDFRFPSRDSESNDDQTFYFVEHIHKRLIQEDNDNRSISLSLSEKEFLHWLGFEQGDNGQQAQHPEQAEEQEKNCIDESGTASNINEEEPISARFVGKKEKNNKKRSWKDIAVTQTSNEAIARWKENESPKQEEGKARNNTRGTGSLRQLMGAKLEPEITIDPEIEIELQSEIQTEELQANLEKELDFKPDSELETENEQPVSSRLEEKEDKPKSGDFQLVTSLGIRQDQESSENAVATEEAFAWYFSNGNDLFANEQFEEAEKEYSEALEVLSRLGTPKPEQETVIIENLGELYMATERPDLAVNLFDDCERLRVTVKLPRKRYMKALLELGQEYEKYGQIPEAEYHYRKAVNLGSANFEDDEPLLVDAKAACMKIARNKATLLDRFSPSELEKLKEEMKASDLALLRRKPKLTKDNETLPDNIWIKGTQEIETPQAKEKSIPWLLIAAGVIFSFVIGFILLVPNNTKTGALKSISAGNVIMLYR
ncbi:MAG: tetratricopeptide repeat protein, partial [Candidatus Obscuribacterales bacterium]|nr:tetratricopeptide repeat protein [Candidatus Obscuribacterales bacterium]